MQFFPDLIMKSFLLDLITGCAQVFERLPSSEQCRNRRNLRKHAQAKTLIPLVLEEANGDG